MNYVDTQLYIPHQVESDYDCLTDNHEAEVDKIMKHLTNLVELNYINLSENSLKITKSGYDYFMRKCQIQNNFEFDRMAPSDIQQAIFQTFFQGKTAMNTVEKFIKANLKI